MTALEKKRLGTWIRLITNSNIIVKEIRNRFRSEFDVTLPRFDLMSALDRCPAGLTMGELSKQLLVSNGNVTGVVERLQNEGLVKRWALPTDKRVFSVGLTAKGKSSFKKMARVHEEWINEIFGDIEDSDLDIITEQMDALRASLKHKNNKER